MLCSGNKPKHLRTCTFYLASLAAVFLLIQVSPPPEDTQRYQMDPTPISDIYSVKWAWWSALLPAVPTNQCIDTGWVGSAESKVPSYANIHPSCNVMHQFCGVIAN